MSNAAIKLNHQRLLWRNVLALLGLLLLAGEASAANFVVRMQGTRFVPRDITITVGDSITWTNLEFSGHDSVSGTNGVPNGFWRTPLIGFGGSATVVFTNIPARSYGYYCTPHVFVGMVGSVTVLPPNPPPTVTIESPLDGAVIPAGVPLDIVADAKDDGRVVRVDFFVDGTFLGSDSVGLFTATYANPTVGDHILSVVAVDDRGAVSAPVTRTIHVFGPLGISISQPPSGTVFTQLNTVSIVATVTSAFGVTNVEYLANDLKLGEVAPVPVTNQGPIRFDWQPTALGPYTLTAIASDESGLRATSAPVAVSIYNPADVTRPTIVLLTSSQANFARMRDTDIVWLTGTASDDQGLSHVELFLMNQFYGGTNALTGTTNWFSLGAFPPGTREAGWQTGVTLLPGQNTLLARTVDLTTNVSPTLTRYYTYVSIVTNLTVLVHPGSDAGSVSPDLTGKPLEIGKTYRMTARPAQGWVLDKWTGVSGQGPVAQFVMRSDLRQVTVSFLANPFRDEAGPYSGLLMETNTFAPDGNGLITLQLTESGAFTGRLRAAGRNQSFRGALDYRQARGSATILRPSLTPIVLYLTNESGTITGTATDGSWVADLLCHRNPFATGTNLCPYADNRVFFGACTTNPAVVAIGGNINLSARGKASSTGYFLLDGWKVTVSSSVSTNGAIPIAFSSAQFDSFVGWANVGLSGDLTVSGWGVLIPTTTNTPATYISVSGP